MSKNAKLLQKYMKELEKRERDSCFDALRPGSRASEKQQEIFDDIETVLCRYLVASNQCFPTGTLVMTPAGPTPIEQLQVGDTVYDEKGQEQKIIKTWDNGEQDIADVTARGKTLNSCTSNHRWWVRTRDRNRNLGNDTSKVESKDLNPRNHMVARTYVQAPLGEKNIPDAYALGALLGDGCSRDTNRLYISSQDFRIPDKVAAILGGWAKKCHPSNYTYQIKDGQEPTFYPEWCKGRYAHEKIVDLDELRMWNRTSVLRLVAGLIDTDGSVVETKDHIRFGLGMQALPVIEAFKYACLALWQVDMSVIVDKRTKYKNGPVYTAYTNNKWEVKRILEELSPHLVLEGKRWKTHYAQVGGNRSRPDAVALTWGRNPRRERVYNITVDGANHVYLLANGLVSSNCGKSMLGAREAAWLLQGNHPNFDPKKHWGERPLTMLMIGKSTKMMQNEIWDSKIKPLLSEGSYKESIQGGVLQWVTHRETGNKLIFISHNNPNEAREHAQGYVAQWVWLDEMPDSVELFGELITRVISSRGRFLATFTPLIRNIAIKDLIEAASLPTGKRYKLAMADNPIFAGRLDEVIAQYAGMNEQERNARLYGEWYLGSSAVYTVNSDMIERPEGYHPSWRHVEAVDPASSGKTGYILMAERPSTGKWYVVRSEYIDKDTPSKILDDIKNFSGNVNVVKRISDPHEAWFISTAREAGFKFIGVANKNNRKKELISSSQQMLYDGKVKISSWCEDLLNELTTMQWSESGNGKIVNAQKYHCADSFQYACDSLPPPEKILPQMTHTARMKYDHRERIRKEQRPSVTFGRIKPKLKARNGRRLLGG